MDFHFCPFIYLFLFVRRLYDSRFEQSKQTEKNALLGRLYKSSPGFDADLAIKDFIVASNLMWLRLEVQSDDFTKEIILEEELGATYAYFENHIRKIRDDGKLVSWKELDGTNLVNCRFKKIQSCFSDHHKDGEMVKVLDYEIYNNGSLQPCYRELTPRDMMVSLVKQIEVSYSALSDQQRCEHMSMFEKYKDIADCGDVHGKTLLYAKNFIMMLDSMVPERASELDRLLEDCI